MLLHYRRPGPAVAAVLLAGVASIPLGVSPPREAGGTKVLRIEEGVMGQIKVVDQAIGTGSSAGHTRSIPLCQQCLGKRDGPCPAGEAR